MSKNNKQQSSSSKSQGKSNAYAQAAKANSAPEIPPADVARKEAGVSYCQQIATEPGWHTLPSGVIFRIVRLGRTTPEQLCPNPTDNCIVNYKGTFIDGTKFDSSYDRAEPASFKPNQVIRGWGEVLQFMAEGDAWDIVVPWHQAYGAAGAPPNIPPFATLCFSIELKNVRGPDPVKAKDAAPPAKRPAAEAREQLVAMMEKPFHEMAPPAA